MAFNLHHQSTWLQALHVFMPFLLVLTLGVILIWALLHVTRRPVAAAALGPVLPDRSDPALEAARMRYARGEIGRDDFLSLSTDLGSEVQPASTEEPTRPDGPISPPAVG
jgi:uncharacterized membrane protein